MVGNMEPVGFVDDGAKPGTMVFGIPVLGSTAELGSLASKADEAIVAIGNNVVRQRLFNLIRASGIRMATVIHPGAIVSPSAVIGDGCALMAGSIVGTEAIIEDGVIINCGAIVDHHCKVLAFAHIGVGACMAGGSVLGRLAWMQAGSALGYRVQVADQSVLAPGEGRMAESR